jgi:hypothetical protein
MIVVTNTGPLIALAKINQLTLLDQLFSEIQIPPAVHRELLAKSSPETTRLEEALDRFIRVAPSPELPPEVKVVTLQLDTGEQHAVSLAYHLKAPLIIDDRLGRFAAQQLRLPVTGSIGVLIQGKDRGLVPLVGPLLEEARRQGYWFSDELVSTALKLAGES